MSNSLRQIRDIQMQADKICSGGAQLEDVAEFGRYSKELKTYLSTHVEGEFVQQLIGEIPDLEEELRKTKAKAGLLEGIGTVLGGGIGAMFRERRQVDRAKGMIKEIQGKYASIEFILKSQRQ